MGYPEAVKVSDEIPELSRGGEAVSVFDRLFREGYVLMDFGNHCQNYCQSEPEGKAAHGVGDRRSGD